MQGPHDFEKIDGECLTFFLVVEFMLKMTPVKFEKI